jgi:anti-anti-sigma factor
LTYRCAGYSTMTMRFRSPLDITSVEVDGASVLTVAGVLDSTTYAPLRNAIVKAAIDEPAAVVVDVSALSVPRESALAVFTSAHWHVNEWRDVPLALVCSHAAGRDTLRHNGITRYLPVYASLRQALDVPRASENRRRRARAELPGLTTSVRRAQQLVAQWLERWSMADFTPAAVAIATVFVENAVEHSGGDAVLRVESDGRTVTVAVDDTGRAPAAYRDGGGAHGPVRGLEFVRVLCRAWGSAPTDGGKTVWAVIGPENRL